MSRHSIKNFKTVEKFLFECIEQLDEAKVIARDVGAVVDALGVVPHWAKRDGTQLFLDTLRTWADARLKEIASGGLVGMGGAVGELIGIRADGVGMGEIVVDLMTMGPLQTFVDELAVAYQQVGIASKHKVKDAVEGAYAAEQSAPEIAADVGVHGYTSTRAASGHSFMKRLNRIIADVLESRAKGALGARVANSVARESRDEFGNWRPIKAVDVSVDDNLTSLTMVIEMMPRKAKK